MIVVIGEALVDLVVRGDGPPIAHVGGSPLNVATGLARLGREVVLGTTLGADAHGDTIREHLRRNHVRTVELAPTAPTSSMAVATLDDAGRATYDFRIEWHPTTTPDLSPASGMAALHTGSLATALQPGARTIVHAVQAAHDSGSCTLTYDPNIRPALLGDPELVRREVESLVRIMDVVKASDEDLAWLYPAVPHEDVAARWASSGPALVVVTRGAEGAHAAFGTQVVDVATPEVSVVDTVGAGDAFMAGLLAGLDQRGALGGKRRDDLRDLSRSTVVELLRGATEVAALTVTRPGADPPTLDDITRARIAAGTPPG